MHRARPLHVNCDFASTFLYIHIAIEYQFREMKITCCSLHFQMHEKLTVLLRTPYAIHNNFLNAKIFRMCQMKKKKKNDREYINRRNCVLSNTAWVWRAQSTQIQWNKWHFCSPHKWTMPIVIHPTVYHKVNNLINFEVCCYAPVEKAFYSFFSLLLRTQKKMHAHARSE